MKDRQQPETLRLRGLMPALTVNDLETSLGWYRDVLGFIVAEEIRHEDRLVAVRLKAGSVEFLLGQDDFVKGRDRAKGVALRLYCITGQDIDQLAAAIQARGGKLAQEPRDEPWGTRDFAMVDPDGFLISITTPVRT
ncbi:MAG TPA: VOC family protein [Thermoanaerobaculia bacterium]|nr:VOC family protein [Thermoanaerobaculia bacterium]